MPVARGIKCHQGHDFWCPFNWPQTPNQNHSLALDIFVALSRSSHLCCDTSKEKNLPYRNVAELGLPCPQLGNITRKKGQRHSNESAWFTASPVWLPFQKPLHKVLPIYHLSMDISRKIQGSFCQIPAKSVIISEFLPRLCYKVMELNATKYCQ